MNLPGEQFHGKLAFQQRVLPVYRVPFFDQLALACTGGFSLFAGQPRSSEAIRVADELQHGLLAHAENRHVLGGRFYLCYQPGIVSWLEEWQPNVLVVEANSRYPNTLDALEWMHARSRPVLGWGLGALQLSGPLGWIRRRMRENFLFQLDGVIAYSERGAAEYRAMGIAPERVFVAHNAAVHRPDTAPPARPDEIERAVVLFVGRLQARKRLDLLFLACAALPEEMRPEVIIVGDGPARGEFETYAKQTYPRARFVGAKHGPELTPYYARADLFVLPGTGGLAVQQAMAQGLPVIVAQGDGTQEDLVRTGNGWLLPPDDLNSLAARLLEALSDPGRLRKMGAESHRITVEEINLEQMAAKFVGAINQVRRLPIGDGT
ncbi:MAG: glycosyltransferase family 4 protein [Anaerolineales bacterium]|jgi:glycosyltransferase involved in cell wall biosynthesis